MISLSLALLALSIPFFAAALTPPAVETDPAIFFIPHQDDEVLTFGADIKNHVLAGRRVLVVLLTDGSSSGVCKWRYSNPNGTYDNAGRAKCTAYRDNEFINAVNALGAEPVIREDREQDGSLSTANVLRIMEEYLAMYPNASFKAPSYRELDRCNNCNNGTKGPGSRDHGRIGQALQQLPGTTDKRYYLKPELWSYYPTLGKFVKRQNINAALDAYSGFGWYSVPHTFHEQMTARGYTKRGGYFNSGGADSKVHS